MNRLKQLRNEIHKLQDDIGKAVGVSGRAIGNYETEKREMSPKMILKLSEYFGVTTDYLLGKSDNRYKDTNISNKQFYMCPVYGKISAGLPNWAEECIEGYLPLDPDLMGIANPEEHFFLKVNGESMNKIIRNGAYALIHKQDYVENGEIAVILVNGNDATLKHFSRNGDIAILSPDSDSDEFNPFPIDLKTTSVKILGKYVGKMEFNN